MLAQISPSKAGLDQMTYETNAKIRRFNTKSDTRIWDFKTSSYDLELIRDQDDGLDYGLD